MHLEPSTQAGRGALAKRIAQAIVAPALVAFVLAWPFLPGSYSPLARPLSLAVQIFGLLSAVLVPVGLWMLIRRRGAGKFSPALYLVALPALALTLTIALAAPITAWSRSRAIERSAELIRDIEAYREANGAYPEHLAALWPDYLPGVVGVAQYSYVRSGDAYSIYFEQPRLFLDEIGAREIVVYNPLDEHRMVSHAGWILQSTPEAPAQEGWYASRDAGAPHWKSFLFD